MHLAYFHYLSPGDSALTHVGEFTRAAQALGVGVDVHALRYGAAVQAASVLAASPRRARAVLKRRLARYLHEPADLLRNYGLWRRERAIVRAHRPDVLLARAQLLTASYVLTARRAHLPLVLEVNAPVLESVTYQDQYAHLPWIPGALERWQLDAAEQVIVVSSPLKTHLLERYGLPASKLTVVPNGADVTRFSPAVAPAARPAGTPAPVVGFVGSFQEFHGIDLLAGLIVRLAAARPLVRFLLVGDGPGVAALRQATAHLGERVVFTGRVAHADVPALVTSFDIGVLPDTGFHCCPLKVLEWMAAGRAVVAPRYANVTDLVTDGVDGLLFAPRDQAALLDAVTRLVDDAAQRAALGAAARLRVTRSFTWESNARQVVAACHRALTDRAGTRQASSE